MGFLNFFLGEKKSTASVAKERLQLILAHRIGDARSFWPGCNCVAIFRDAQEYAGLGALKISRSTT